MQPRSNPIVRRGAGRLARGFTLVELMIALAVAAVLLALATPSFNSLMNANRLTSASNEFVGTLQAARMEALRRNATVQVCTSDDEATCDGGSATWIVRTPDGNNDGNPNDAEVLRVSTFHPAVQASGDVNALVFRADGFARDAASPAGPLLASSFSFCIPTHQPEQNVRQVSIASGSRVSTEKVNGGGACN